MIKNYISTKLHRNVHVVLDNRRLKSMMYKYAIAHSLTEVQTNRRSSTYIIYLIGPPINNDH